MQPRNPLHLFNSKRQYATERTRDGRCGEEESDALRLLVALIPEGDVIGHTGEETRFCQAEKNTCAVDGEYSVRAIELGGKGHEGCRGRT